MQKESPLQRVLVLQRVLQVQQRVLVLRRVLQVQQLVVVLRRVQHFVRVLQVQLLNSESLQIVQTLELGEFRPLVRQLQVSLLLSLLVSPLLSLLVNKS